MFSSLLQCLHVKAGARVDASSCASTTHHDLVQFHPQPGRKMTGIDPVVDGNDGHMDGSPEEDHRWFRERRWQERRRLVTLCPQPIVQRTSEKPCDTAARKRRRSATRGTGRTSHGSRAFIHTSNRRTTRLQHRTQHACTSSYKHDVPNARLPTSILRRIRSTSASTHQHVDVVPRKRTCASIRTYHHVHASTCKW